MALFRSRKSRSAFTLVEVVVSIAVVVFALVAIFGLMTISLKNSREANLRQGLTMAIDQVYSMYQGQSFTNAVANLQSPTNYYFDNSGLLLTNSTGAYFQCTVSQVPLSNGMVVPANVTANNLAVLQLQIAWPYPHPTSTDTSIFSILNYQ